MLIAKVFSFIKKLNSMKKYILSIEQGTTSSKVILYNSKFNKIDSVQKEFKQYFPKDGWVEHDAFEIWLHVKKLLSTLLRKNKLSISQILSIGIANQRETTVLWNKKNGKPINRAIVWQDRRTSSLCNNLKKKGLEKKNSKSYRIGYRSLLFCYKNQMDFR